MKYQKTNKSKKSNKKTNKSKTRKKVNKRYLKTQKKIGGVSFSSRFKQFFRPYKPFIIETKKQTDFKMPSMYLYNNDTEETTTFRDQKYIYGDVCIEIKKGFNIGFIYPEYVEDNHQPYYFSFNIRDINGDKLPIYFEGPPRIPNKLYRKGKLIARRAPNNLGRLWPVKIKTMDGTAKLKLDGFNEENQPTYKPYKILQDGVYYQVEKIIDGVMQYLEYVVTENPQCNVTHSLFCNSYQLKTNLTEISYHSNKRPEEKFIIKSNKPTKVNKDLRQLIELLLEFMDFVSRRLEKNTEAFSFGQKDFNKLDIIGKSEETIYNNIKSIINKGIRIVKNFISNYKTVFDDVAVYSRLFESLLVMEKTNEKIIKNEIRQINNLGPNNIDYQSVIKLNNSGNFNVNSKEQFFSVLVEKLMAIFKYALEQLTKNLNTALSEKDLIEQSKSKSEHVQIKLDKLLQNKDLSNTQIDIFLKEYEKDIDNNNRTNLLGFLSKKKLLASSQRARNKLTNSSNTKNINPNYAKLKINTKTQPTTRIPHTYAKLRRSPHIYETLKNSPHIYATLRRSPHTYAKLSRPPHIYETVNNSPHTYAKLSRPPHIYETVNISTTPYENVDDVAITPDSSHLNQNQTLIKKFIEPFNNSTPPYYPNNIKTVQAGRLYNNESLEEKN
jgi:hypothetical protein